MKRKLLPDSSEESCDSEKAEQQKESLSQQSEEEALEIKSAIDYFGSGDSDKK